jgi:NNP family nitrate/nitrite transporter-like MFS transporter
VAEALLAFFSWRTVLAVLGIGQLCMASLFLVRFSHGRFKGQMPRVGVIKSIVANPAFWVLAACFALAVGASLGPYAMLPLYLVEEHGFTRPEANLLLAASRASGLGMAFVAGALTDRFGALRMVAAYMLLCSLATLALAVPSGTWLIVAVVTQPALSVCFFPAGFTLLSRSFDASVRNVAVSLITPFAALLGAGLVPAMVGLAGDLGSFGAGFAVIAGTLLAGLVLPWRLSQNMTQSMTSQS